MPLPLKAGNMGPVELRESIIIQLGKSGIVRKSSLETQGECPKVVDSFLAAWVEEGLIQEKKQDVYHLTKDGQKLFNKDSQIRPMEMGKS